EFAGGEILFHHRQPQHVEVHGGHRPAPREADRIAADAAAEVAHAPEWGESLAAVTGNGLAGRLLQCLAREVHRRRAGELHGAPGWATAGGCGTGTFGISGSFGSSLLPITVRFRPSWTCTGVPSISRTVLPLRYQPNEPVENSLMGTTIGTSLMVTVTGLA